MFHYEKKLQYPVKIKNTNPKLASWIISQYGGPDTRRLRFGLEAQAVDILVDKVEVQIVFT
jgi:uncharacterized iron-regulated protein